MNRTELIQLLGKAAQRFGELAALTREARISKADRLYHLYDLAKELQAEFKEHQAKAAEQNGKENN